VSGVSKTPFLETLLHLRSAQGIPPSRISRASNRDWTGCSNRTRADQRELRRLERQQSAQQQRQHAGGEQGALRGPRTNPQQIARGRFATAIPRGANRTDDRRIARLAAHAAWRLGRRARHVPWLSAVYWPYAYADMFYYTFWPGAYDPGYWAYAYDDLFDGIYFPDGAPYVDYAYVGPYEGSAARVRAGGAPGRGTATPGRVSQAARDLCLQPAKGITAWPFAEIEKAVQLNSEQNALLDDLKKGATDAATQLKDACPDSLPLTPPGRLQAMIMRLDAIRDAVTTVRPALEAFYNALSDEQKARFNEIGPQSFEGERRTANNRSQPGNCDGQKDALSSLPIDRIDQVVHPTADQVKALDRLKDATQKAIGILSDACPITTPLTPVGRIDVMEKRLDAMIKAASSIRPALEDFYATLSNEQKARFNRLDANTAQSGR
jgi:hypothetical protein